MQVRLFLAIQSLANVHENYIHRKNIRDFLPVSVFLGVGVVLLWTLTFMCEVYLQRVSRRLANLPFIFWLVRSAVMCPVNNILMVALFRTP